MTTEGDLLGLATTDDLLEELIVRLDADGHPDAETIRSVAAGLDYRRLTYRRLDAGTTRKEERP